LEILIAFTYRKANIDNAIRNNETASIIVRIDMFWLAHEIKNSLDQEWLCEAKSSKSETRNHARYKIPSEMRSEGP
jgi:hypothetical protein